MDMSYLFYMAEQEGQLDTKWSKIQKAIAEARPGSSIREACRQVGLDYYSLSLSEIDYMKGKGLNNAN